MAERTLHIPTQTPRTPWLAHGAAALLLALFAVALYGGLLFTNRMLASGDILLYFYPYRALVSEALPAGRIPLWNPYIFMGAPLLANPQAAVLYPLHLPLLGLSVTQQVYWSATLHTWLLGLGGYALMRRLGGGWLAALISGVVIAGSGFYGGMIGHLNQMNGAAWLPWALLLVTPPASQRRAIARLLVDGCWLALVVALMLLAGHTQTAYINLFGAGVWTLVLAGRGFARQRRTRTSFTMQPLAPLLLLAGACLLGVLLSAPQLLPTLELSRLGIRSGGLSFLDATSFSLKPLALPWTLLPTYGLLDYEAIFQTPAWSEFIAWLGISALLLAALGAWRGQGLARWLGVTLVVLGFGLALGRWNPLYYLLHAYVPGFDLFRTPARWMILYTLGGALLAGLGAQVVVQRFGAWRPSRPALLRAVQVGMVALVALDLGFAARALPQATPTAPEAVYALRSAPAHLATDPTRAALHPAAAGRFLGMSTVTYDPGDMADFARLYRDPAAPQLAARAFDDLIIGLKVQELLVPNLPMLWQIPAVDGYDGGTLPLQRYNALVSLLRADGLLAPDGRLREQIDEVPASALLALLNVDYVVTDKVRDLWFDDVYYDRQIGARLTAAQPQQSIVVPAPFSATHLDLILALEGDADALAPLTDAAIEVAQVAVQSSGQSAPQQYTLTAGGAPAADFADRALDTPLATTSGATIAYRDVEQGAQAYRVRLALDPDQHTGLNPEQIDLELTNAAFVVEVQAATLYDARTRMFLPLLPSDRGWFELVHSGDVKVYENRETLPRAWLAYATQQASGPAESAALLAQTLAESTESRVAPIAIIEGDAPLLAPGSNAPPASTDGVTILSYAPEQVEIAVTNSQDALLVLADAFYPGWRVTVDGAPAIIHPTNVLFRGVHLPAGEHRVLFTFAPDSWRMGLWVGGAAALLWLALLAGAWRAARRNAL